MCFQGFNFGGQLLRIPILGKVYSKVLQMVNYTLWANIKGLSASKKMGWKICHIRFKGMAGITP
jgi:putative transposase